LVAYLNNNGARRLTRTRLVKAFRQELTKGLHSTFFDHVSHRIWWTRPKRMQEEFVFCIHDFGEVSFAGKMLMLTNRSTRNYLCLQSSVQFARNLSMSRIPRNLSAQWGKQARATFPSRGPTKMKDELDEKLEPHLPS
jgi:hypothetical protein